MRTSQDSPVTSPALIPTINTSSELPPPPPQAIPPYDTNTIAANCLNKYSRFVENSRYVGWVVTRMFSDEPPVAMQYQLPAVVSKPVLLPEQVSPFEKYTIVPTVTHVREVSAHLLPNGHLSVRGFADGRLMRSRRAYNFSIANGDESPINYTFYPCSPVKTGEPNAFDMPITRFADTEEARNILQEKGIRTESGEVQLSRLDIYERDKILARNPDQNQTMGESAVAAVKRFSEQYRGIFTPEFLQAMKQGCEARLSFQIKQVKCKIASLQKELTTEKTESEKESIHEAIRSCREEISKIIYESRLRYEWLHGESYRHTPMADNPQRPDNLGAAMAWLNTKMMIFEGVAKWFELHVPDVEVKTYHTWDKFFDTHVLNSIRFKTVIRYQGFTITCMQTIDPYVHNPEHVKTSDIAGLTGILSLMIQNVAPVMIQPMGIFLKPPVAPVQPVAPVKPRITMFVPSKKPDEVLEESILQNATSENKPSVVQPTSAAASTLVTTYYMGVKRTLFVPVARNKTQREEPGDESEAKRSRKETEMERGVESPSLS